MILANSVDAEAGQKRGEAAASDAKLALQPVSVDTGAEDHVGVLVFADGQLVAVLVRLDGEYHENLRGRWHLEAGFGRCAGAPPPFESLRVGVVWTAEQLNSRYDKLDKALDEADRLLTFAATSATIS